MIYKSHKGQIIHETEFNTNPKHSKRVIHENDPQFGTKWANFGHEHRLSIANCTSPENCNYNIK